VWRYLNGLFLLFAGALVGSIGFPHSDVAGQYRLQKGQSFWPEADEQWKTAYLLGYLDAETIYRSNMDLKLKGLCTASGKKWIDDFDYEFPLLQMQATIIDLQSGLDDFYKDDRNRGQVGMYPAQRIVRLKLAGRSQAEIDAAEQEAHGVAPR
jgi:hypothetical protein